MNKLKLSQAVIDFSRGQISNGDSTITVEPKVMAVLECLVQCKGEVVSQEHIFNHVWPNAVYSPSLIQRSIAVLRKALGDDAKQQQVIRTHPKRGYSLNAELIQFETNNVPKSPLSKLAVRWSVFSVCAVALLAAWWWLSKPTTTLQRILEVQQISATDQNESKPQYLSDSHVSFIRSDSRQGGSVWVYNTRTEAERQITLNDENLSGYQWIDTNTLVFALLQGDQLSFFKLTQLDIESSGTKQNSASTELLTRVDQVERIRSFYITKDNQLIYLVVRKNQSLLISRNLLSNKEQVLLEQTSQFEPYEFSVNAAETHIATSGFSASLATQINVFDRTESQWSTWATLDSNIYQLTWHPEALHILLTQGKQLLILEQNQKPTKLAHNSPKFIADPVFNADGSKILVIEETIDADLWIDSLPFGSRVSLVNSTATDYAARYSSDGQYIAFISTRKGYPQVYITDIYAQQTRVVFHNPEKKLLISAPVWHPTKPQFMTAINERLVLINMTHAENHLQYFEPVAAKPLAWYPDGTNILIENVTRDHQLSTFNTQTQKLQPLTPNAAMDATLGPEGQLILIATNALYHWQDGNRYSIANLEKAIVSFVAHRDGLYIMTSDDQTQELLVLDWKSLSLKSLGMVPTDVYVIWDIDPSATSVLFETTVTHRNVIELSLHK